MTPQEIVQIVQEQFPNVALTAPPADKHPRIELDVLKWAEIARFMVRDPRLKLDWLANLTGIDYVASGKMAVVYDLFSLDLKHTFAVKVFCPRETPNFPSFCNLWSAANWHEREAFDLLGIIFEGHPNLTRILCAEDWVGYPLRKDYVFPKDYKGIPADPGMPWDPATNPKPAPAAKTPVK